MARGQNGLRGGNVLYRVEWVFSLDTGSVWVCSLLKVGFLVWAHTERTECAVQPRVTVGLPLNSSGFLPLSFLTQTTSILEAVLLLCADLFQGTEVGVSGATGPGAPSHVVGGFRPGRETVTPLSQRGRGGSVKGGALRSSGVTPITVPVGGRATVAHLWNLSCALLKMWCVSSGAVLTRPRNSFQQLWTILSSLL